jgi:peptide/nickel transport system ATP-binding protein/oligopeptide transport system ATP-binding protein
MNRETETVVSVRNLKTYFQLGRREALAVDDVSFDIHAGKTLALVGESGCGKSVTALSIMRLIPEPPGRAAGGTVTFQGRDLLKCTSAQMRDVRRHHISMIFQEPMTSLNPIYRVGDQIGEAFTLHRDLSKKDIRDATIELLEKVGIPSPGHRVDDYPHQLSGGMRQRVMIAMALACDPQLLIADEPTTALDVTIQAQILNLLQSIQRERQMTLLLITHDLGVVAEMADEVAVMYAGKIVQSGDAATLFANHEHPYTSGLFNSLPQLSGREERLHTIEGHVPGATDFPSGCRFHPRCEYAMSVCKERHPAFTTGDDDMRVACWLHDVETMSAQGKQPGLPAKEAP